MAQVSDPIESFARFLAQAERSPLTIKNYRGDLDAFAVWFEEATESQESNVRGNGSSETWNKFRRNV